MKLPAVFERYRAEIDTELRSVLADHHSGLYEMLQYQLGWIGENGNPVRVRLGKRVRPTLCLLASEAISGTYHKAIPAAAALELVHNFSLIHDDIQDNDVERRNRPTVWSIWGKPQAINAGTAMWILAGLSMTRLIDRGVPIEKQLRAQRLLDESSLKLIEGQYLDISFEGRLDVSMADYLEMVEGKTASLIACSLEEGALLSTDDERVIRAFRNFGENLGFAFQIQDDILGIWGVEEKMGKPAYSDIRCKKKSFPIVYAWEMVEGEERTLLRNVYQRDVIDDNGQDRVLSVLDSVRAREKAQSVVEEYCAKAIAAMEELPLASWACDSFREVLHFLIHRDY